MLAYVRRGEAAVGMVYGTEIQGVTGVRLLHVPRGGDVPAPLVVGAAVRDAGRGQAFEVFLTWLLSPKAQKIFKARGFRSP